MDLLMKIGVPVLLIGILVYRGFAKKHWFFQKRKKAGKSRRV